MEKHLENIEDLLVKNLIVKVIAPSASGKTTLLPNYLAKKYDLKVIVANENIAQSLNSLNILKNIYISSKSFLKNPIFPSLLIIDEMDTGSFENFLIISLWKKSKKQTKLILLSSLPHNLFPEFPNYRIFPKKNSEIRYINNENLIDLVYQIHNSTAEGDFLIFTIKPYIDEIIEKCKKILDADFYSSETIDPKMYVKSDKRKIIVASDVAKTSLTLDSIKVIFDTMLERRLVPTITGGARIKTEYISKRDADLRARNNCIVYRFITLQDYQLLPDFTEELIFRIPLHHLMIDIYNYNMNPFEVFSDEKMELIYKLFIQYGIIDFNNKITQKGKLLRKLPFGIRTALLCLENMSYSSIVLASCIENYMKYTIEFESTNLDYEVDYEIDSLKHIKIYFERFRGFTDAETVINIFQASKKENNNLEDWCYENYIEYSYLSNVHSSIENITKTLNIAEEDFNITESFLSLEKSIREIYGDKRMLLLLDSPLNTRYMDNNGEVYNIDPSSINSISIQQPIQIYGIILSNLQDEKSISFCF